MFIVPRSFGAFRTLESSTGTTSPNSDVFRKDILRVGTWKVGDTPWVVTPKTLSRIVESFNTAKSRGLEIPVVWNHSNDARDRCGKILALAVSDDGQTLFADVQIPNQADAQKVKLCEVSIGHVDQWTDGAFNVYEDFLVHLGVVNHPVIPAQGPFRPLSLVKETSMSSKLSRWAASIINGKPKFRQLAEGEQAASTESVVSEIAGGTLPTATEATSEQLAPLFKELFDLLGIPGLQLSDGVTDETLLAEVKLLLGVAKGMKGGDEPAEEDMSEPPVETVEGASMAAMPTYASLLASWKKGQKEKQLAFTKELDTLCESGRLNTAQRDLYLGIGKQHQYNLSILEPLKDSKPTINTKSKTRHLSNGSEPNVADKPMSDADYRKAAREFLGIPETATK